MLFSMAWRNLQRHRRRTVLTVLTMAVSLAGCITMSAWMAGMVGTVHVALVDRQVGHFQIHHADYPTTMNPYDTVADAAKVLDWVAEQPAVKLASPRVLGFGLFGGAGEDAATGAFFGVDPQLEASMTEMNERVTDGAWLSGDGGAVVGHKLADELELKPGDELLVVTNALDGSFGDRVLTVAGIFKSNNLALDGGAYVTLNDAQALLAMDDSVHEIVVLTEDEATIPATTEAGNAAFEALAFRPWWEVSPEAVEAEAMQGVSNSIFSVIILGIAAFIIINTLLMSVYERTREFGVLTAVGMKPKMVVQLVLTESFLLALMAVVAGMVVSVAGITYLVEVGVNLEVGEGQGFEFGSVVLDPVIYGAWDLGAMLLPTALLFFVSVVGGLWPAMRAAGLDPVVALRQE